MREKYFILYVTGTQFRDVFNDRYVMISSELEIATGPDDGLSVVQYPALLVRSRIKYCYCLCTPGIYGFYFKIMCCKITLNILLSIEYFTLFVIFMRCVLYMYN